MSRSHPRIILSPVGTRGDFAPMAALASGLRRAGAVPVMVASRSFDRECVALGLEHHSIDQDDQAFNLAQSTAHVAPRRAFATVRACFDEAVRTQFEALLSATRDGADLLIGGSGLHFAGPSVAEALGIPFKLAVLSPPVLPSNRLPPPVFDWPSRIPSAAVRVTWKLLARAYDTLVRPALDRHRRELGLGPLRGDILAHLHGGSVLFAVDPELSPVPSGYPSNTVQTHAWRAPRGSGVLAPRVERFLESGAAPVFVGFGSNVHSERDGSSVSRVVIEAMRRAGARVIFARHGALDAELVTDGSVLVVDSVDHAALFPRVSLVVHHGGAGVVNTAARAGVPQFAVPHMTDLFYWGHRLHELGVGPAPVSLSRLDVDSLHSRVVMALASSTFRERARAIAARLEGTDGVAEAVAALLGRTAPAAEYAHAN